MNKITTSSFLPSAKNFSIIRGKTFVGIDFGTSTTVVSIASYDDNNSLIHTNSLRLKQKLPDGTLYSSEIIPSVIAWINNQILVGVNPAKRNVLDLKNETCKNREKRNVLKISHTRHFKAIKKQSRTGCFYSF